MLLKMLLAVLPKIFVLASPALKEFMSDAIHHMEKNAAETNNMWDDVLVAVLKSALGIKD